MNISTKNLFQEGFMLLILTIAAFIGSFYYEVGYCKYYGIPSEYISIEIPKNSSLLFGVIVFLYFLTLFRIGYTYLINRSRGLIRGILKLIVNLIFGYLFYRLVNLKALPEGSILLPALAVSQAIIHYSENLVTKSTADNHLTIPILMFRVSGEDGQKIGHFLYAFVLGCLLLLSFGYFIAGKEKTFYSKNSNHLALIKRYENTNFYCLVKSDTLLVDRIIIEENPSLIDTLQVVSVRGRHPNK